MGYTTYFSGEVGIDPALNTYEIDYLTRFSQSRRMNRRNGPYYADPGDDFGQSGGGDVIDYNAPGFGQPGLWCEWIPSADGTEIAWNEGEGFSPADAWMAYLIDTFLCPGCELQRFLADEHRPQGCEQWMIDPAFEHFSFDHVCNGVIFADGEASDDFWKLVVTDNQVAVYGAEVIHSDELLDHVVAKANADEDLRRALLARLTHEGR